MYGCVYTWLSCVCVYGCSYYRYPFDGEFGEYQCSSRRITRMRVTVGETHLITASADGCVFIMYLGQGVPAGTKSSTQVREKFSDYMLVTSIYLDERDARVSDLRRQLEEVQTTMKFQLRSQLTHHNEAINAVKEEAAADIGRQRRIFDETVEEKDATMRQIQDKYQAREAEALKLSEEKEKRFQKKVLTEVARYQKLTKEMQAERAAADQTVAALKEAAADDLKRAEESHKRSIEQLEEEMATIREEHASKARLHEEMMRQFEEEADAEIEELKMKYETKLADERDELIKLTGAAGIQKKKQEELKEQQYRIKEDIHTKEEECRKMTDRYKHTSNELQNLQGKLATSETALAEKDAELRVVKKQVKTLEKRIFVEQNQVEELQRATDRTEEIAEMNLQVQKMRKELEEHHIKNGHLEKEITQMKLKSASLEEQLKQKRGLADSKKLELNQIKYEIHEIAQNNSDSKQLKTAFTEFYRKYAASQSTKPDVSNTDMVEDLGRQRDHLETTVESLKKKVATDRELYTQDHRKLMSENVELIRDINDLRNELAALRSSRSTTTTGAGGDKGTKRRPKEQQHQLKRHGKEEKGKDEEEDNDNDEDDRKHTKEPNPEVEALRLRVLELEDRLQQTKGR
eukprot:GHVU01039664.1.p1 GENE.GHVU01039664.1~~GHVU01039664.1.p1  ORF type:complete len:633 (-),score=180.05 GHVU01039664.1:47-1945(-)